MKKYDVSTKISLRAMADEVGMEYEEFLKQVEKCFFLHISKMMDCMDTPGSMKCTFSHEGRQYHVQIEERSQKQETFH